jgi:ATP adenylyltransferase
MAAQPATAMWAESPEIAPGGLAERLSRVTRQALASGALRPIATRESRIDQGGVAFLVRQVDSLARKAEQARDSKDSVPRPANPFLPPEPALVVGIVSDTHLAVLNKFKVLPNHLLLVTRRYVDQETLLDLADMTALHRSLEEIDGLCFYNGGQAAGASQPHKHLQLVPLPLADETLSQAPRVPMDALIEPVSTGALPRPNNEVRPGVPPFRHALARLDWGRCDPESLRRTYLGLLGRIGVGPRVGAGDLQSAPYNLLVTRRWMMAVPRVCECVEGVSVNALGFAGSLFVKDATQMAAIRRRGPMAILIAAAGPAVASEDPGVDPGEP